MRVVAVAAVGRKARVLVGGRESLKNHFHIVQKWQVLLHFFSSGWRERESERCGVCFDSCQLKLVNESIIDVCLNSGSLKILRHRPSGREECVFVCLCVRAGEKFE